MANLITYHMLAIRFIKAYRHSMNRFLLLALLLLSLPFLTSCYSERASLKPLSSVSSISLDRYQGRWYEIARFDAFFQKDCIGVTADYKKIADDTIEVINSCRLKTLDGELKQVSGVARIADIKNPAQLKVKFSKFPSNLLEGNYWVVALDTNYKWAVVSEPQGRYLWILSRTKTLPDTLYNKIIDDLKSTGIKTEFLQKTKQ